LRFWRFQLLGVFSVHRETGVRVDVGINVLGIVGKGCKLLVTELSDFCHLRISIGSNKFLDDHVSTAHPDDQFAIQNLCVDLLSSKEVESIAQLPNGDRAIGLVKVVTEHLVKDVSLGCRVDGALALLILDPSVHNIDDLVFVLQQRLHFLDFIYFFGHRLAELIQAVN